MSDGFWKRVDTRTDEFAKSVPTWARPTLIGAGIMFLMIGVRAGLILVLLVLGAAAGSRITSHDLAYLAGGVGLAVLSGALSGTLYSVVGRPLLMRVPRAGPYLTGLATLWPYGFVVVLVSRLKDGVSLAAPVQDVEWMGALAIGVMVGVAGGGVIFGRKAPGRRAV